MKKVSDVFKSIRFAKGEPRDKTHSSTDDEEHGTVGEMDFDQQLAHAKKRAMQEAKEKSEYDYEGDMARGQLQSIINNAQRVHDMLKDNDNLPEWVQSKITLAEDYISTVANYMMSEVDEEVEIQEAEALVENFEIINEVSLGAKIRAYASHAGNAFAHDDMGNDKEYKHHSVKANKIIAHIEKHHGKEAVKHAERAAHSQIFGHPDHEHSGEDRLSGGLRGNKNLTKAGKVPKNTVSAMKNKIMAYGRHRDTAGPKAKLPEEVDINAINGVKMSNVDESSHQAKTTMKHIPNASPELKKAAKDIKPGIAGFRDRVAMLKAGGVKK